MTTRQKNTWLTVLILVTVLLGVVIQLMLGLLRHMRLRAEAEIACENFLALTGELSSDENARLEALGAKLASSSAAAFEKKEEKLEMLDLLVLVNPWNKVPEDYQPILTGIGEGQQVDSRCADDLLRMLADCEAAGCQPYVCSSYRTQAMQQQLFDNKVMRVMYEGVSYQDAPEVAARSVAVPGTSEHQLGLAVDIIDENYPNLTQWQEYTPTQQWLIKNCWKYGFILRYPNGTTDITGIIYEPWHYRYVGEKVAAEVTEMGITFEEYLILRRGR